MPFVEYTKLHEDDRGSVYCALDNIGVGFHDDKVKHERSQIKRIYVVKNWSKGTIRAWHLHRTGWTGMHVIKGAARLAAREEDTDNFIFRVLSDRQPGVFWVPPGWYNGSMSLEDDTRILVLSTLSFEEVKQDDKRIPLSEDDKELFKVRYR